MFDDIERLLKELQPISLFYNGKTDLGKCRVTKLEIDLHHGAIHWKGGRRAKTPLKIEKTYKDIQTVIELALMELFFSLWHCHD